RVVALLRHRPIYLELEVLELSSRIPQQTHAAFRHEHSVLDPESAWAGLPPAIEINAVEELDRSPRGFGERSLRHEAIPEPLQRIKSSFVESRNNCGRIDLQQQLWSRQRHH